MQLSIRYLRILGTLCEAFRQELDDSSEPCLSLPPNIIQRPDPAIYDQKLELAQGRIPTWDNPDITTHDFPPLVPLDSITATTHNRSTEVSALNTMVKFDWSEFGIGLPRNTLGAISVNLAPNGFPGDTQQAAFPLPTTVKALRSFSVFITLSHPHDSDLTNNEGEQAFDARITSESGRFLFFDFPVQNPTSQTLSITMTIDPIKWSANINPPFFILNPGQQQNIQVTLDVPTSIPAGTLDKFSVYASSAAGLLGGVALLVFVDV